MTDKELIARLRSVHTSADDEAAADRIEALVKERDQWIEHTKNAVWADSEELKLANARIKRLEAAVREIEAISVHSGGETHGVTADHWKMAFDQAQSIASAALK